MQDLWIGLGGLVVAAAGFVLAYAVFRREAARAEKGCGERDGMLLSEIGYVKSGVDDIKAHQREQDNRHLGFWHSAAPNSTCGDLAHHVYFEKDSRIRQIIGKDSIVVNSYHHQNVKPDAVGKGLRITGVPALAGGTADGANDHRIVMAAAVAAVRCSCPVTIRGAEACAKSYPAFFGDLAALGARIREE